MTWSRKQILGHLIDSAGNNHQRFVRTQFEPDVVPSVSRIARVAAQGCDEPWADLVDLWRAYNLHLLHVASRIPEERAPQRLHRGRQRAFDAAPSRHRLRRPHAAPPPADPGSKRLRGMFPGSMKATHP